MEIIKETSTQLVIRDFPNFWFRLTFGLFFGSSFLPIGLFLVLSSANSFFSAFLWGVFYITPSLVILAILPRVDTFLFDRNLGYFQVKRWKPFKKEGVQKYPLETINGVKIEKYQGYNGMILSIWLILDEGQKKVRLSDYYNSVRRDYYKSIRKSKEHAKAIARFLNVRNYGMIEITELRGSQDR